MAATPTMNLKKVTALVVDNGLFVDLAVTLGQSYGKVYYTIPSYSGFPKLNAPSVGRGLPGIEVVEDIFGPHFEEIDLFVFPDCYHGDIQMHLVSLGKRVWGARLGEKLELDRVWTKQQMKKVGYPVGPYKVVHGMQELRAHLKANKNQHVKISRYRGSFESFGAPDYKFIEPKLDEVEYQLGARKNDIEIIVEDSLPDKMEFGEDMYCIDGQFPTNIISGIEIKDEAYVGIFKPRAELPEPITRFDKLMAPTLKDFQYRGFYSAEVRIGKDKVPYMIDHCSRAASPPSELYQAFYLNLAEIIWEGAGGIMVDPKPLAKYGAEALIISTWADKNPLTLDVADDIRPYIKLRNVMFSEGRYKIIPRGIELSAVGAVIGFGDTMEQAIDMVKEVAENVKGYYVEVKTEALDRAQDEIDKGEEYGIKIF